MRLNDLRSGFSHRIVEAEEFTLNSTYQLAPGEVMIDTSTTRKNETDKGLNPPTTNRKQIRQVIIEIDKQPKITSLDIVVYAYLKEEITCDLSIDKEMISSDSKAPCIVDELRSKFPNLIAFVERMDNYFAGKIDLQ